MNNEGKEKLLEQIKNYKPFNDQEEKDRETILRYLNEFDEAITRENEFGHMCASAFVLNKQRTKIVMVHHNIFKSWGWMGGHADSDYNLLEVAIKEAKEESGITNILPIYDDIHTLDILPAPGHYRKGKYVSAHAHPTLAYLLEADETESLTIQEEENSGVEWVPIDEMVARSNEWYMQSVYQKSIDKMRALKLI